MAYSDYGGYAYRNGERVEERSDATITPDGDTFGTPGCWPGFAMIAAGVPHDEVQKRIEWPSGHAVLGDGPVYLVLRKTYATLYRGPEAQDLPIGRDDYDADEVRRMVELDGCKVELIYTQEDNYYVYARLTQPDGNVWHGWSGYGVGAGLEDAGYGYSTSEREIMLWELFGHREAPNSPSAIPPCRPISFPGWSSLAIWPASRWTPPCAAISTATAPCRPLPNCSNATGICCPGSARDVSPVMYRP